MPFSVVQFLKRVRDFFPCTSYVTMMCTCKRSHTYLIGAYVLWRAEGIDVNFLSCIGPHPPCWAGGREGSAVTLFHSELISAPLT